MATTKVTLLEDGYKTTIQTRHHVYHADEPTEAGGTDAAVTPTEMAMGALGSCLAMTMKMYAERKEWPLEGVEIEIDMERFNSNEYPLYEGEERFVHEVRKGIKLHGPLTEAQKDRIIDVGSRCPVARLLATPTFFVERVIEEEAQQAELE